MADEKAADILSKVKPLAVAYHKLTKRPLGVTGEVAENAAVDRLGLKLAPVRTAGYDAIRLVEGKEQRIQIKGRAFAANASRSQRIGVIKRGASCDTVLLVLLDSETLDPCEMWEASYQALEEGFGETTSPARGMSVPKFKRIARKVWPA